MKANIILERAADYIVEHGWRQGTGGGHGDSACVLGAIDSCSPNDSNWYLRAVSSFLDGNPQIIGAVSPWNDAPERTADDVVLALRRAARSF